MDITKIQNAAIQARQEALTQGIPSEQVDLVASIMATMELLQSNQQSNGKTSTSNHIHVEPTFAEWAEENFNLKSHPDRFLAAALYLSEKGQPEFTSDEVIKLYAKARWEMPKNPADVLGKAANKMLFAEVDNPTSENGLKIWRLTRTGLMYLENIKKGNEQ